MFKIFDAFTGELKRTFSPFGKMSSTTNKQLNLPFVKWSFDEKYFAYSRASSECLNVFSCEDFKLCDGKTVELEGLANFSFNSAKNIIAYYCEEKVWKIFFGFFFEKGSTICSLSVFFGSSNSWGIIMSS